MCIYFLLSVSNCIHMKWLHTCKFVLPECDSVMYIYATLMNSLFVCVQLRDIQKDCHLEAYSLKCWKLKKRNYAWILPAFVTLEMYHIAICLCFCLPPSVHCRLYTRGHFVLVWGFAGTCHSKMFVLNWMKSYYFINCVCRKALCQVSVI